MYVSGRTQVFTTDVTGSREDHIGISSLLTVTKQCLACVMVMFLFVTETQPASGLERLFTWFDANFRAARRVQVDVLRQSEACGPEHDLCGGQTLEGPV